MIRADHIKSIELEQLLRSSQNADEREKDERIKELEKIHEQQTNNSIHLELRTVHEKLIELEQLLRISRNADEREKDERI